MTDFPLESIVNLVRTRTGWELRDEDGLRLREKLQDRLSALGLNAREYAEKLEREPEGAEWEKLVTLLSNPETFFFRDSGQIALLRDCILPELVLRRRPHRSLRIWSAGCSTGEEPYSLAFLLQEVVPDLSSWEVLILGSDMNPQSLNVAREGRYREWSFRGRRKQLDRYFNPDGEYWRVKDHLRRLVTFRTGNLVLDRYPDHRTEFQEMDLIICRNVFIYFSRPAVSAVVSKMAHTLREGGYLVTGHSELHGVTLPQLPLVPRRFSASLVYQLGQAQSAGPRSAPPGAWHPRSGSTPITRQSRGHHRSTSVAALRATNPPGDLQNKEPLNLTEIAQLLNEGRYHAAQEAARKLLAAAPAEPRALSLAVRAAANTGDYSWAADACRAALERTPFAPEPFYFLAQIAEEQGKLDEAKELLKKCLYVSPTFVPAYLELGAVYDRERNTARAVKMRTSALELLRALPADAPVDGFEPVLVGELVAQLETQKGVGRGPV